VSQIIPAQGPTTGNTHVTIVGTKFVDTGEITVLFANTTDSIVSGSFSSPSVITCISPPFEVALTTVRVALNGQQYTTSPVTYLFYDSAIVVQSLSPASGPITGGTQETITGSGFVDTGNIYARFSNGTDSLVVAATFVDSNHVACITPDFSQNVSTVVTTVEVALNGQQFTDNGQQFYYYGMLVRYLSYSWN